jgi:hypothetical protein
MEYDAPPAKVERGLSKQSNMMTSGKAVPAE